MNTGYKDKNGKEIALGDKVKINANPHHGIFEVKFGEYQLKPFHKKQIEVPHLGFYLTNGNDIVSLMHVLKQPTGAFASTHSIEIVESAINTLDIIKELYNNGISIRMGYNIQTEKTEIFLDGFYKSDHATLIEEGGKLFAHTRYDKKTEINSLYDIAVLNHYWWESSRHRFEGWKNPDPMWIPVLEKFNLITKKVETTWE